MCRSLVRFWDLKTALRDAVTFNVTTHNNTHNLFIYSTFWQCLHQTVIITINRVTYTWNSIPERRKIFTCNLQWLSPFPIHTLVKYIKLFNPKNGTDRNNQLSEIEWDWVKLSLRKCLRKCLSLCFTIDYNFHFQCNNT